MKPLSTKLGDHLGAIKYLCTRLNKAQRITSKKNKTAQFVDGWPFRKSKYFKQPQACVPDYAKFSI